jgi:pimeloyl-ACP methyl ester carboxylesterase
MQHAIDTTLGTLHVEISGNGPEVILWHSLFLNNRQWDRVLPGFTEQQRVIAIEGPGHGQSKLSVPSFTLEDCATAAIQIMDALDVRHARWVGNAWGGHVGIVASARYAERITSLTTIGSPLSALSKNDRKHLQVAVWMYKTFGPRAFLANKVIETLLTPDVRANDKGAVEIVRRAFVAADRQPMGVALDCMMLGRPDLASTYNHLSIPRLMLVGNEDEIWSPAAAHAITEENPDSTIISIAGASHIIPLERPDATIASILEFWDRVYAPVPAGVV